MVTTAGSGGGRATRLPGAPRVVPLQAPRGTRPRLHPPPQHLHPWVLHGDGGRCWVVVPCTAPVPAQREDRTPGSSGSGPSHRGCPHVGKGTQASCPQGPCPAPRAPSLAITAQPHAAPRGDPGVRGDAPGCTLRHTDDAVTPAPAPSPAGHLGPQARAPRPPNPPTRVGLSLVNVYSGSLAPAHRHGNRASCTPPSAPPPRGAGTSPRVGSPWALAAAAAATTTHSGHVGLGDGVGSKGVQGHWGSPPPCRGGAARRHPDGVTAPAARPRSAHRRTGAAGVCAALPTRLGAALFINRRSRGLSSSCRALPGHPAQRHAATEPAGTVAPRLRQPGGTMGTRLPVGLAEPRGAQMPPWHPLGRGVRPVQHAGTASASPCPLRRRGTPKLPPGTA